MKRWQIAAVALAAAVLPGCRPGDGCEEPDAGGVPAAVLPDGGGRLREDGRLLGLWEMENTPEGIDANLVFLPDGGLAGSTGVNNFFGTFSTGDGLLTLTVDGMTRAAGSPEAMDFERNFIEILTLANGFAADDDELLLLNDGTRLAAFERKILE